MKSVINSLDDVSEGLRGEYEAGRDGKFYLKVEDAPKGYVKAEDLLSANAKVTEFRDKNISLLKETEELRTLKTKLNGVDPEEAVKAVQKVKDLSKSGVNSQEDLDQRLASMVDAAVKPLREQVTASAAQAEAERKRADEYLLKTHVTDIFTKSGGKAKASDFVVDLAKNNFEVKDGKVVAKVGQFSKTNPGDALSPKEWVESLADEHDYVFEPSRGGGALPRTGPNGSVTPPVALKPGQTILKNPTPQQLGEYGADIKSGKVKIVNEPATT